MDKKKLKQLADYAVREGLEHSEDGQWAVSYEELFYHFGVDVSDSNDIGKLLKEELRQREEIHELVMTEDCIEMTHFKALVFRLDAAFNHPLSESAHCRHCVIENLITEVACSAVECRHLRKRVCISRLKTLVGCHSHCAAG